MGDIRFIVPFGRQGAADRAARAFTRSLVEGPRLTIENIPGAGGFAGVERANSLAAAGEPVLLLSTPTTHILLPARRGAHAAPSDAFKPVLGLGSAPNVLLVSAKLGVRSVDQLIARAHAGDLTYASAGAGQTIHLCTALFCAQAGIRMLHRPYDGGSASAYGDLIAGTVHVYFDNLLGCRERVERGEALALAVSSPLRSPHLPSIPTLVECGFPGHALDVWMGVFGSKPPAAGRFIIEDALAKDLGGLGLEGGPIDADALAARVQQSRSTWTRALDSTGEQSPMRG